MTETPAQPHSRAAAILLFARSAIHLAVAAIITVWALLEWPLPWPGVLAGAGFLAVVVLLWALFLSPRPMLRADRFGQALIELLLIAGAVGALLGLGAHWIVAVAFGAVAAVLGYLAGRGR